MPRILTSVFVAVLLTAGVSAFAAGKPHAVIVVGTHHYSPQKTMPPFAGELERLGFRTTVINPDWDPEKDKRGLPGLEALAQADVALFFTRFLKLEDEQLIHITKYLETGKPVVGFRTSTHAFNYPKDHPRQELNASFGRDALGTPYLIHLAGKTRIKRVKGAEQHPILTGVEIETWESPGTLYLTKLEEGVEPLLVGTGNAKRTGKVTNQFGTHELQKTMTDTVAWTWSNKWGGRTFTTSLGHVGDFSVPQSMRVMVNGIFWAAGLEVPSAKTKIRTLALKPPSRKPNSKPTKKRQRPAKKTRQPRSSSSSLPDTRIKSGGVTIFYGNSMVERLQEEGTLEALLQAAESGKRLQFRSLAYTGDEVGFRIRPEKFGDHLGYLAGQLPADRVVMCFGMNEAFAGSLGTEKFMKALETYLSVIKDRHPKAELILVSPTAIEDVGRGRFPDAAQRNAVIADYCQNIKYVAAKNKITYVDLFNPSKELFARSQAALTINGLHLNAGGNRAIAKVLAGALASAGKISAVDMDSPGFRSLRRLVSRKAYEVAMAYKPANGIHYYGVRSRSFEYESEVPHHLRLANLLDAAIWAQAADLGQARPFPNLPTTKAEPPEKRPRKGLGVIKTAQDDLRDFTVADGFTVNAFASSEDFPELINPLQINFDARGRLWVACFASYPVPVPGKLSNDKILIFEDTDGDGRADKRTVFADNLKLPDGFVFFKDGIIASIARKLVWLRDTDGDDVADVREEMLRGADDTDTHHGGYLARTPQGQVIYCEGLFHRGQFETPYGPVRTKDATALYLDPITRKLTIQRQTTHPNPWKISYNRWGEAMQMFGGGQIIDCEYYDVWTPVGTSSSGGMGMPFRDDKGCTLAWVSSPHFPKEWQGGLVTGHLLSKNAVLFTPLKLEGGTYVGADKPRNLLSSPNKVFRPTDLAFGLDGALYVSDFYYPIIGHAQHSIRDANRDYANGRVWRVTRKGAPLVKAPAIAGASANRLFSLLTHSQVRVRELARLELEKKSPAEVLKQAKSKVGTKDELLALELLWLFERNRDFSQTNLFKRLVKSKTPEVRRAAARSLRWWAPVFGKEALKIASELARTDDDRTRMAVISVASYLQVSDPSWREFIHKFDAAPNTPLAKVASLAALYDTPALKPQFPLLKVDSAANLAGWLMNESGHGGSLIIRSEKKQDLVLGFRGNAFINLNLNNIPLHRATGSLHTKNGQINVTLEPGENKIDFYTEVDGRSRAGKADLYLATLIGGKPEGLTFANDATQHLAWTTAYDKENATVTEDRIRLKSVPSKMAFNATRITVKAGHKYTFSFENPDHMLHNIVITKPGKGTVVGEMVDAMTTQPDAMAKHFIPDTDLILFSTPQIPYGGKVEKEFTTPSEPGRYPFICTFPGHWRLMAGVMIVEDPNAPQPKPAVQKVASRTGKPKAPSAKLTTSKGVVIEAADSAGGFKHLKPAGSRGAKVTAKKRTSNDPVTVLTDGMLAKRFGPVFGNGITDGAYKMDLGSVKPVRSISSWSHNQASKRGAQRVRLYGSDANKDPGWDLSRYTALGSIETGPAKAAFTAASLRAEQGKTLGEFRWIVWSVQPITTLRENTAFQELAVETESPSNPKPKTKMKKTAATLAPVLLAQSLLAANQLTIDSPAEWKQAVASSEGIAIEKGMAAPTGKTGAIKTKIYKFDGKRSASSLIIKQSAIWQNWNPIENLGPINLQDAPVLLTIGPDNYWMFGRYGGGKPRRKRGQKPQKVQPFEAKSARLEGFDIPLKTTRFPNQFDAPGGLKPGKGGYHAWQSRDMKNWVHHGPVTEKFSKWVTSAEYVDGKTYIYYDFPNDQDPHVYVDADLTDGEPGRNMGIAVKDPSHGSDAGFIRDLDGNMHVIIEDWSPISANKRSWDSPLAGHAVSKTGLSDFKFGKPAVDNRTKPTGKIAEYKHPHWAKEDPKRFPTNIAKYEVHEPEQEAYGDWASICIGGQYYLFGDYDPAGGHSMSVGWFTSPSIDQQFTWCDKIGNGHPDPDVCFAEGRFYLATQQKTDFVSPGPWVESVEARVGVDTNNDGKINKWSKWTEVKESYDYIKGFSKQIKRSPATLDLKDLPAGHAFQIELKITDTTENKSKPMIESLSLSFR